MGEQDKGATLCGEISSLLAGNTKEGSITVPLTSYLTGLD